MYGEITTVKAKISSHNWLCTSQFFVGSMRWRRTNMTSFFQGIRGEDRKISRIGASFDDVLQIVFFHTKVVFTRQFWELKLSKNFLLITLLKLYAKVHARAYFLNNCLLKKNTNDFLTVGRFCLRHIFFIQPIVRPCNIIMIQCSKHHGILILRMFIT